MIVGGTKMSFYHLKSSVINQFLLQYFDKNSSTFQREEALQTASFFLAFELSKYLPNDYWKVQSYNIPITLPTVSSCITLLPILRAGLPLVSAFRKCLNANKVVHVMTERDSIEQIRVLNDLGLSYIQNQTYIILDAIVGKGVTINTVIENLELLGIKEESIYVATIMAAPQGVKTILDRHKDVSIFSCYVESHLDLEADKIPRCGDVGYHLFGV